MKILVSLFLLLFASLVGAETITGKVVGVSDGDTVTVLGKNYELVTIRLAEIDAPEKVQPFGELAKKALSDAVFQREAIVEVTGKDKYGRSIGRLFVNGEDINKRQVRSGYAWAYKKYLTRNELLDDEAFARGAGAGLWRDQNSIPPWEWRKKKKTHEDGSEDSAGFSPAPAAGKRSGPVTQPPVTDVNTLFPNAREWNGGYGASVVGSNGGNGGGLGGSTVHTGPRGGKYTITSGGNKSYLPKR